MSDDSTLVLTGLQLVIMGDVEADAPDGSIGFTRDSYWSEKKQATIVSETIPSVASNNFASEKLRNLLMTICLEYPFWNDFRILDFFNKRGISITMKELRDLRVECGIESREDVCLELMRLYFNNEIELDKKQVA